MSFAFCTINNVKCASEREIRVACSYSRSKLAANTSPLRTGRKRKAESSGSEFIQSHDRVKQGGIINPATAHQSLYALSMWSTF